MTRGCFFGLTTQALKDFGGGSYTMAFFCVDIVIIVLSTTSHHTHTHHDDYDDKAATFSNSIEKHAWNIRCRDISTACGFCALAIFDRALLAGITVRRERALCHAMIASTLSLSSEAIGTCTGNTFLIRHALAHARTSTPAFLTTCFHVTSEIRFHQERNISARTCTSSGSSE